MSTSDGSTAANILTAALGHMRDRAATYDKPEGERSMGATVDAFNAVTGVSMTEEQGWLFMALLTLRLLVRRLCGIVMADGMTRRLRRPRCQDAGRCALHATRSTELKIDARRSSQPAPSTTTASACRSSASLERWRQRFMLRLMVRQAGSVRRNGQTG